MVRKVLASFLVLLLVLVVSMPVQAESAATIRYTTALSGDGETGGCPNTATLGLLLALWSPVTGYDWWNLCFGAPRSGTVHVAVVDDSGLPVRTTIAMHSDDGILASFPVCGGEGGFAVPPGTTEVSVTVHASPLHPLLDPPPCAVHVPTTTPTTGAVTVSYL